MIFRKKEEIINPYTQEKCDNCNTAVKRKFGDSDYVFKPIGKCPSCKVGQIIITQIFGEVIK